MSDTEEASRDKQWADIVVPLVGLDETELNLLFQKGIWHVSELALFADGAASIGSALQDLESTGLNLMKRQKLLVIANYLLNGGELHEELTLEHMGRLNQARVLGAGGGGGHASVPVVPAPVPAPAPPPAVTKKRGKPAGKKPAPEAPVPTSPKAKKPRGRPAKSTQGLANEQQQGSNGPTAAPAPAAPAAPLHAEVENNKKTPSKKKPVAKKKPVHLSSKEDKHSDDNNDDDNDDEKKKKQKKSTAAKEPSKDPAEKSSTEKSSTEVYRGPPNDTFFKEGCPEGHWPEGWTKVTVERPAKVEGGKARLDHHWVTPKGKLLRSRVEVQKFFKALTLPGVDGDEKAASKIFKKLDLKGESIPV